MRCRNICLCTLCFSALFICIFAITITLNFVGVKPRFYIQELYIPALNNPDSYNATNLNTSIIIDLKFKRVVAYVPIRYKDVNFTLYYGSNRSSAVGFSVLDGFFQNRKKTVHRRMVVEAGALPWEDAFQKLSGGCTVALTAELATRYMLKRCNDEGGCSYTKPKTVVIAADLHVDSSGADVSKKPIRLH